MEGQGEIQSKRKSMRKRLQESLYNALAEILAGYNVQRLQAAFFIATSFLQIYGTIIWSEEKLDWDNSAFTTLVNHFFRFLRILPGIVYLRSTIIFWIAFTFCTRIHNSLGCLHIVVGLAFFTHVVYCIVRKRPYSKFALHWVGTCLVHYYWLFYGPSLEILLSVNLCTVEGVNIMGDTIECYGVGHVFCIVLADIFTVLSIGIVIIIAVPSQKVHSSANDFLAQLENPLRIELVFYRTFVFAMTVLEYDYAAVFWLKYAVMFALSAFFVVQYFKYLPYYDYFVSLLFGYFCSLQLWVLFCSLLTFVMEINGHFVIMLVGAIPAFIAVKYVRDKRFDSIFFRQAENTGSELEALIRCHAVAELTLSKISFREEVQLAGLVTLHLRECKSKECPLHSLKSLYDPCVDAFASDLDQTNLCRNLIFKKYFAKHYFDSALSNFGSSPNVKIAYAFYMFNSFKNVHAALLELREAKKNSPSPMQSFEIYKLE
eukprot:TRINITY_DN3965_c0_g1_i3.p1 TRINITY_DN3965_c0_g1~~TRINITY_DN3965_c0_g1_i3.p1  ORF type:complete len:487 (-),score=83.17 TRINITY_DN3965_c0_g1_i3:234-1694(-)